MTSYLTTRDITPDECNWLKETIKEGMAVYKFDGRTYGCIGSGIAVTFSEDGDNPFFELPYEALKELPIR